MCEDRIRDKGRELEKAKGEEDKSKEPRTRKGREEGRGYGKGGRASNQVRIDNKRVLCSVRCFDQHIRHISLFSLMHRGTLS